MERGYTRSRLVAMLIVFVIVVCALASTSCERQWHEIDCMSLGGHLSSHVSLGKNPVQYECRDGDGRLIEVR